MITIMDPLVSCEMVTVIKSRPTQRTLISLLSRMSLLMDGERQGAFQFFPTDAALKFVMSEPMFAQVPTAGETFPTRALKRLFPGVGPLVPLEVGELIEGLSAVRTLVWLFSCVCELMLVEMLSSFESLSTRNTLIRLLICVCLLLMTCERRWISERLEAQRALVSLLPCARSPPWFLAWSLLALGAFGISPFVLFSLSGNTSNRCDPSRVS